MQDKKTVNRPYDIPISLASTEDQKFFGTFTHRSTNRKLNVEGFVHDEGRGVVRYALPLEGAWDYAVHAAGETKCITEGTVTAVVSSDTRYPIEVMPTKVRPVFAQDDKPYFMSMYECNWLFALWMKDEEAAKGFLKTIKEYRFNSIAMNLYAHACAWTKEDTPGRLVPPPLFNWGGTNDSPDFTTINPEFYERFDGLMECMYELDLIAHLYLFVWNKGNSYPAKGSPEEAEYVSYVVRRYQAFPNIIWDYCKEAYLRYDKQHIREMMEIIRNEDAYGRLLTIHDDKIVQYDESFDHLIDFYTMQIHHDYFSKTLREVEKLKKPVFNEEYTYESGKDITDKTFEVAHTYEAYMLSAWEVALAGSPICYYYTFTAWDVIRVEDRPQGYAGSAFLVNYFESFDWWNYTAAPEENLLVRTIIACAKHIDRDEFILLTDRCGRFSVVVDFDKYDIEGEWVDIYTGERKPISESDFTHEYNSEITFLICPFGPRHGDMSFYLAKFELKERA